MSTKPRQSKNIKRARSLVNPNMHYKLTEAISLLREMSYAKFDQTVEVVLKLGVDPKHGDQIVQGTAKLPAGSGKKVKVAVICKPELVNIALEAGADVAGTEIINDIKAKKIDFDVYIATPDMMGLIGQVARILGPKGLMPTAKFGTLTNDISAAVRNLKGGQVQFRVEKNGIIHAGVGKLSFSQEALIENTSSLVSAVIKAKPAAAKGAYLKELFLSATMTPAVRFQLDANTLR